MEHFVYSTLAFVLLAVCAWGILSVRVPSGVAGTVGLGMIGVACMASFDPLASQAHIARLLLIGNLLVFGQAASLVWRSRRGRDADAPLRRESDWGGADADTPTRGQASR